MKVIPLVTAIRMKKSVWTVAEVQRQLRAQHQINVTAGTLRRHLRRSGFNPEPRQSKASQQAPWTLPWPREYGASRADYLQRQAGQSNSSQPMPLNTQFDEDAVQADHLNAAGHESLAPSQTVGSAAFINVVKHKLAGEKLAQK